MDGLSPLTFALLALLAALVVLALIQLRNYGILWISRWLPRQLRRAGAWIRALFRNE